VSHAATRTLVIWALELLLLAPAIAADQTQAAYQTQETASTASSARPVTIYVARRKWHVDVGFAVKDLEPPLRSVAANFPGAEFVFFGFGDRHYLLAKDRHIPALLGAVWPGAGIILATGLKATPAEAFGASQVIPLRATGAQAHSVQGFLWGSLLRQDGAAEAGVYAPGPYPGSLYFAATPGYSGAHTCNTWVAEVLEAGGLPVHSAGVIFAGQLWTRVSRASALAE
jgi:hypothetical protein